MIEAYLQELARELGLRTPHVRRILLEVEAHLRDSARELGEAEALARFGTATTVAASFARESASHLARCSAWAVAASLAAVVGAYLAVENGSPPAPWPSAESAPDYLRWKVWVAERLIVVAFVAGAAVIVHAYRPAIRFVLAGSAVALSALAAAGVLGAIEAFQRAALYRELGVEDTPLDAAIAAVVAGQLLPVAVGGALVARGVLWARLSSH